MAFSSEWITTKHGFQKKLRAATRVFALGLLLLPAAFIPSRPAQALGCGLCTEPDLTGAALAIIGYHAANENVLMLEVSNAFDGVRGWMVGAFFQGQVLPALMLFTEQMSAVAMHQTMVIGMFLDAKHQLETQRLFQELQTEAHKDYNPSEDFCWFGTNVRSMAASEQIGRFNSVALGEAELGRQLGNVNRGGAESSDRDKAYRWQAFAKKYCDPKDNNFIPGKAGTGLEFACGAGGGNTKRINIDVDYTRAIDEPRTLDVNFTNGGAATPDEEDVIAMASNLYGNDVLTRNAEKNALKSADYQHLYLALRSVAAKRSVAQNSFDAIVGLKSAGSPGVAGAASTGKFLGAVLTELGVPAADVYNIIGEDPSYYAQLEILAKKIYQNPDFYSNLYDKPANVARKSVALKAIDLMLDRAIFESQLRQEMATSVLLSARLRPQFRNINKDLMSAGGD